MSPGEIMKSLCQSKFQALMLFFLAAMSSFFLSCGPSQAVMLGQANEPLELGNQLGDVMASIDEAGKGSSTIAFLKPSVDRYQKSSAQQVALEKAFKLLIPEAQAVTCGITQFGACSSNTMVRNFNGCTIGAYTLTGTVTMAWTGGANCSLSSANQAIRITPNYSVNGNNLTLTSINTGTYGVTMTLATSATTKTWNYTNDGIRRTLSYNGTTLLELNTRTNSALTVTGSTRGNRTLTSSASALEIINNTTGNSCSFQANSLSWGASNCNCATTGSWSGSCSNLGNVTMTMTGCGVATVNYTDNGTIEQQTISLDRCVQN